MAGNKTVESGAPVQAFLDAIEPASRRGDALALCAFMERVSGEKPRMWGTAIVGFGQRHYRTEAGREGDICRIGFSPRKAAIALYIVESTGADPLVARLGKISTGKSCIYVKSLADIDLGVLEALIERELRREKNVLS